MYILLGIHDLDDDLTLIGSFTDLKELTQEAQEQIDDGVIPSDFFYLKVGESKVTLHRCSYEPVVSWEKV